MIFFFQFYLIMILIAHRGNYNGKNDLENHPEHLRVALSKGFYVETDVWYIDNLYYLGHDKPCYRIEVEFLENPKIICHCKNIQALQQLTNNHKIHCFFHNKDDYTLTSEKWIWCYSMKTVPSNGIMVMPKHNSLDFIKNNSNCKGICSDNLLVIKSILKL